MKINTYSLKNAGKARGLVVVIDVLRAFSTVCYLIGNKAEKIVIVGELDLAYRLKKENPGYVLIGEREGLTLKGFDFGNSPAQIKNMDFSNKTIIFTTSRGTKGIIRAVKADEIITGSFVNAEAIVEYIGKKNPKELSFICTDMDDNDNEDVMLVKHVKDRLKNKRLDFQKIVEHLENHSCADGFIKNPMVKFSKEDFYLCLDLDRFDFVLKIDKDPNGFSWVKRIEIQ